MATLSLKQIKLKILGQTIPVININGAITQKTTQQVSKRLKSIDADRALALAVAINCPCGKPVQTQIIANKLTAYAIEHNLKLMTFAMHTAASSGYYLLSHGHKAYAAESSIVGNITSNIFRSQASKLFDSLSLDRKKIPTSKKLLSNLMDQWQQLDNDSKEYISSITKTNQQKYFSKIKQNRGTKLQWNQRIENGQIFSAGQALDLGLIDGIGSIVQIVSKQFPGCKLEFEEQNWKSRLGL